VVRVAAYQAPLLPSGSMEAAELIRKRVRWCEAEGVEILCCPEAVLGGLADYAAHPTEIAFDVESGASLTHQFFVRGKNFHAKDY
jgi:predicted amidohydrolase